MKYNKITLKNGREINIFDDVFTQAERDNFYNFCLRSLYRTDSKDNFRLEHQGDYQLACNMSIDDLNNMQLLSRPGSSHFKDYLDGYNIIQSRINISTLNDRNRFHVDGNMHNFEDRTLLYYPNLEWNLEWGGYTIFSDENMKEVEYCNAYVPGRVLIFDGKIPHCIAAPTNLAPSWRFTVAVKFDKEIKDA